MVIMNLSSYRNVIIFYKVLPDKTTKPYADIYPYCKDKVTIPFKSTNKLSKKLTMLRIQWPLEFMRLGKYHYGSADGTPYIFSDFEPFFTKEFSGVMGFFEKLLEN